MSIQERTIGLIISLVLVFAATWFFFLKPWPQEEPEEEIDVEE